MHGVKRDRTQLSAELKAQRREREGKKLAAYKSLEEQFFGFKASQIVSVEALDLTTQLLKFNPELYTAWNYRRRVLEGLFVHETEASGEEDQAGSQKDSFASARVSAAVEPASSPAYAESAERERKRSLLEEDLDLTLEVLKVHPKIYWIWNHRRWCLDQLPSDDAEGTVKWQREVHIVDNMLNLDARNFHGWNYRRFILPHLAVPQTLRVDRIPPFPTSLLGSLPEDLKAHQVALAQNELRYTLTKIESNFSNFSAWHHRSLLLTPFWAARGLDEVQKRKQRDEEFELVRQAMFVDPEDQSVWTYHSWLINLDPSPDVLKREIESMRELLELEPDSKWCMVSLTENLSILAQAIQDGSKSNKLLMEVEQLLQRLASIDPDRRERYRDCFTSAKTAVSQ